MADPAASARVASSAASVVVDDGGIVLPKRFFLALGALLYGLVVPAVAVALVMRVYPLLAFVVHGLLFGTMAIAYGTRSTKGAKERRGKLEITPERIAFEGKVLAERGELVQGFYVPTDDGLHVRFERRRKTALVLRVPNEATADAVLDVLGFDAKHTSAQLRVASGLLALPIGVQTGILLGPMLVLLPIIFLAAALVGKLAGVVAIAAVVAFVAYTFALAFAPTKVLVGTDGFSHRWLLTSNFVPFSRVVAVTTYAELVGTKTQRGVSVALTDGTTVRLPTGQTDVGEVEASRLAARLEQARRAHADGASSPRTEVLDRGTRDDREWARALRRLGEGALDHRTAAIPGDALLRMVEDSSATAEVRVSAAIAATAGGDEEAARRVRVAAEATASPRLRVALESVSSARNDDPEIDVALERALAMTKDEGR